MWIMGVVALLFTGIAGCKWYINSYRPMEIAKEAVRKEMKDPDSALFKNVRLDGIMICGEVNAKNSMGGYPGYTQFYVIKGSSAQIDTDEWKLAANLCKDIK